jgi:hypothetical protein
MNYNQVQMRAIKLDSEWASAVISSISPRPKLKEVEIIEVSPVLIAEPNWWTVSDEYENIGTVDAPSWARKDRDQSGPNYVNQWEQLWDGIVFFGEWFVPIFRIGRKFSKLQRAIKHFF